MAVEEEARAGVPPWGESERFQKPVLLMDVDGPLNVFMLAPREREARGFTTTPVRVPEGGEEAVVYPITHSFEQAQALLALQDCFELVWCTSWNHEANQKISPLLGLPQLPVLEFDFTRRFTPGLFYKTPQVAEAFQEGGVYAGRRFLWVDDEVSRRDRAFFARTFGRDFHKLLRVDPAQGFTVAQAAEARRWAEEACSGSQETGC